MPRPRIFTLSQLPVTATENLRGGTGTALCRLLINPAKPDPASAFSALGINTLPPGSSIGLHRHTEDEEIYIIIAGHGHYLDNEGTRHPVGPGDATYCAKGESHGLMNTGTEDMIMTGVIARK